MSTLIACGIVNSILLSITSFIWKGRGKDIPDIPESALAPVKATIVRVAQP